jgi:hypothetical protein
MRFDPFPLVGQVSEIRRLELAHKLERDPCHLVWQVNQIRQWSRKTRDLLRKLVALSTNLIHPPDEPAGVFFRDAGAFSHSISFTCRMNRQGSDWQREFATEFTMCRDP